VAQTTNTNNNHRYRYTPSANHF